jgi:Golgi complex component 7 (COG7)
VHHRYYIAIDVATHIRLAVDIHIELQLAVCTYFLLLYLHNCSDITNRRMSETQWRDLGAQLQLSELQQDALPVVCDGASLKQYVLAHDDYDLDAADSTSVHSDDTDSANEQSAVFCSDWLSALAAAAVAAFLSAILSIDSLSESGARHLSADASYLANVLNALDLLPHPLLLHVAQLCAQPLLEADQALEVRGTEIEAAETGTTDDDANSGVYEVVQAVELRLRTMRLNAEPYTSSSSRSSGGTV